jgi:uncharacterized membrane protein
MHQLKFKGDLPYRVVAFVVPFLVLFVHLALMRVTLTQDQFMLMLALIVAYILPPAGKETVIPVGIALGFPWWYMALSIVMIDLETCLFMLLNFDLAYKIPIIDKMLITLTTKTRQWIVSHPWINGIYFFAIVLMVMVPVLGSGGVRGSISGKLLGMENHLIFLAILAGTLTGCFGIAYGSDMILSEICAKGILPQDIAPFVCNQT